MSFTWFADKPLHTREEVARIVHTVSLGRGLDELATVIALMTISTEVGTGTGDNRKWWCPANDRVPATNNYPNDSKSDDNRSSGYFQQQPGPNGEPWWGTPEQMMTLPLAADTFLTRLADDYTRAANNPTLAGQFAQRVQSSAFPDRYAEKWDEAWSVLRRALNENPTTPEEPVADNRPDFNEFPIWSANSSPRTGKPDCFLIHTQEGGGGNSAAEDLANYLANPANQVSYHYTISQASDGGVTVVDCADTDEASWSVGNANSISINLCFAGSRASWTRDQWLQQAKAIDVAAYLAVQDAKKYSFSTLVVPPPYSAGRPGISDHRWVTDVFKWGTHTDVGSGFPWDVFAASVAKYAGEPTTPEPPAEKRFPDDWTDRELMVEILRQLRGPTLAGWAQLGDKSLVDAVAELRGAK